MAGALSVERQVYDSLHGQSLKTLAGQHGKSNLEQLTVSGVQQAKNLGAYVLSQTMLLADTVGRRIIDVVAASYLRCEATAAWMVQAIGAMSVALARDIVPVLHVDPGLMGLHLGKYNGLRHDEMNSDYIRGLHAWRSGDPRQPRAPDLPPEAQGERNIRFTTRARRAVLRSMETNEGQVLVFNTSSSTAVLIAYLMSHGLYHCSPEDMLNAPYIETPPGSVQRWGVEPSGNIIQPSQPGFYQPETTMPLYVPHPLQRQQSPSYV